jgi:hypothetical protein
VGAANTQLQQCSPLQLQIPVDDRDGKLVGGDIQREDAALAEGIQNDAALVEHLGGKNTFLRGGHAVMIPFRNSPPVIF